VAWNWEEDSKRKERRMKLIEKSSNISVSIKCIKMRIELVNRA
jgi:hypothetical protein